MPIPDDRFFDADGRWLSVEHAWRHAVLVQGGFTTAQIEAERMAKERDPKLAQMGRDWLDAHQASDA